MLAFDGAVEGHLSVGVAVAEKACVRVLEGLHVEGVRLGNVTSVVYLVVHHHKDAAAGGVWDRRRREWR